MNLEIISLQVPKAYLDAIDDIVKQGFYPNRSEAIRASIRDLVKFHLGSKVLREAQNK